MPAKRDIEIIASAIDSGSYTPDGGFVNKDEEAINSGKLDRIAHRMNTAFSQQRADHDSEKFLRLSGTHTTTRR